MATSKTVRKPAAAKAGTTPKPAAEKPRRPAFTDAQLDKVVKLRAEGVPWDGKKGICAAIGASSAIPIRRALRERGGKYAEIVPPAATAKEA